MHACWQTKGPETASSELSGFLRDSWHVPVHLSHRQQCVSHGAGGRGGLPVVFSIFFFTFPIHATLSMPYLFVLKLMFQFFFLGSGEVIIFLTTTNLVEDLGIRGLDQQEQEQPKGPLPSLQTRDIDAYGNEECGPCVSTAAPF